MPPAGSSVPPAASLSHRLRIGNPFNTFKLSSPLLLPRTVAYDADAKPPRRGSIYQAMDDKGGRRRRSSSILQVYHEPPEPIEQLSDQSVLPNLNANWVNAKGEPRP